MADTQQSAAPKKPKPPQGAAPKAKGGEPKPKQPRERSDYVSRLKIHFDQVVRAENDLDRFVCLDRADDPRQHAEHAAFRARRNETGRRRFRIQAAIARALLRPEHTRLSFKPEDRTVNVWLAA